MLSLSCLKNSITIKNIFKKGRLKLLHRKQCLLTRHNFYCKPAAEEILAKNTPNNHQKIKPFLEVVKQRQDEAKRSILVQVQSAQSYKELYSYCNSFGTVKNMLHYTAGVEKMHFIVVEFECENDVKKVFKKSYYVEDMSIVPVQSSFLWFRAPTARNTAKLKHTKSNKLLVENGCAEVSDDYLKALLKKAESKSDQIYKLYDVTKLNDLSIRLRYLVANQVETALSGMFPEAKTYPFGSSVNGCGKMGCDLDLVLRFNDNMQFVNEEARLVFHCKALNGSERTISQRHMETLGDLLQLFLPGCSQVRKILHARVPIIKFHQQLTDVECDLSMANMSGVYMSDFLYLMCSLDERVQPLIFFVKKWAKHAGLTNSSPGRWITNFSLTLMVLSFLQSKFILPSLNTLITMADLKDKFITEDGINCTFLRDPNKYLKKFPSKNKDSLFSLLKNFFEHYSHFDFTLKAISLNDAVPITKPEHSALYIVNPLERGLNVSKNVSLEEVEKFKTEVKNAAWLLESYEENPVNWGVLPLFETKTRPNNMANNFYQRSQKLLEVSRLFDEDEGENVKSIKLNDHKSGT